MSFPTGTGILTPNEVKLVRQVFTDIASEVWFTKSNERKEHFAVCVIDVYREGVSDPKLLEERCRLLAKSQFGNGGIAI